MMLVKKTVTGMKDIMPVEMEMREYLLGIIKNTYKNFGFMLIDTPCVEHINNLTSKHGGDNEKLIFRILKRGNKLKIGDINTIDNLSEEGLRYDLTIPLSRYYSCHIEDLWSPFKSLQIGNVWRADRPQFGRYRQFLQCDIDILGDSTNMAEIELILAASMCLNNLCINDVVIRINDRRILNAIAEYAGFNKAMRNIAFIELDKMDKIGITGVRKLLLEDGFEHSSVDKFLFFFKSIEKNEINELKDGNQRNIIKIKEELLPSLDYVKDILGNYLETDCYDNLTEIIKIVNMSKMVNFKLQFDLTLVRGMNYYTGVIFEIGSSELGMSIGGGGRYDDMIGQFIGKNIPACGFSIGFERLVLVLLKYGFKIPITYGKKAYLLCKDLNINKKRYVVEHAMHERANGINVIISTMKKNKKMQKDKLKKLGYADIIEVFND